MALSGAEKQRRYRAAHPDLLRERDRQRKRQRKRWQQARAAWVRYSQTHRNERCASSARYREKHPFADQSRYYLRLIPDAEEWLLDALAMALLAKRQLRKGFRG